MDTQCKDWVDLTEKCFGRCKLYMCLCVCLLCDPQRVISKDTIETQLFKVFPGMGNYSSLQYNREAVVRM